MKGVQQKQRRMKRAIPSKLRKNAASRKHTVVIPLQGVVELKARISTPFEPMDFRQLIEEAKQNDSTNVDQAFKKVVHETTMHQLNELLSQMHIKPEDKDAYQKAFVTLAFALLGVGQVVWTPAANRQPRRTLRHDANLYWLVEDLKQREGLSERAAIERIASASFVNSLFPYRPQRKTQSSPGSGRVDALWQAWMKAKRRKDEILTLGRPKAFEGVFGEKLGLWESKLVALDNQYAAPKVGKKRSR